MRNSYRHPLSLHVALPIYGDGEGLGHASQGLPVVGQLDLFPRSRLSGLEAVAQKSGRAAESDLGARRGRVLVPQPPLDTLCEVPLPLPAVDLEEAGQGIA